MARRVGAVRALLALLALLVLAGCLSISFGTPTPAADGGGVNSDATIAPDAGREVTVVDVVDGDTIDIRYANGTTDTVRLLGIDTPEVRAENAPTEFEGVPDTEVGETCLREAGERAGEFARSRLAGATVTISTDPRSDRRGAYGRLLAYVQVDGIDINYRLVADGHARVYDTTFTRSARYYAAEQRAQTDRDGLWTCRAP